MVKVPKARVQGFCGRLLYPFKFRNIESRHWFWISRSKRCLLDLLCRYALSDFFLGAAKSLFKHLSSDRQMLLLPRACLLFLKPLISPVSPNLCVSSNALGLTCDLRLERGLRRSSDEVEVDSALCDHELLELLPLDLVLCV